MANTNLGIIKESARGYQSLLLTDVLLQERKVFLTDEVNAQTASELIEQFIFLENDAPGEEIKFYINSPGGSVYSGITVYDCIRMLKSPVTTICIGTAASMGSILFLAGDKREMLPHSRVMIHDPSYGGGSVAGKKPHEIQSELDDLVKTQKELCEIIAERTGQNIKEVYKKTKTDSYFNADEAIAFGLATGIVTSIV